MSTNRHGRASTAPRSGDNIRWRASRRPMVAPPVGGHDLVADAVGKQRRPRCALQDIVEPLISQFTDVEVRRRVQQYGKSSSFLSSARARALSCHSALPVSSLFSPRFTTISAVVALSARLPHERWGVSPALQQQFPGYPSIFSTESSHCEGGVANARLSSGVQ